MWVTHRPSRGTDFWALCNTSATLTLTCVVNLTIIGSDHGCRLGGAKPLPEAYCWNIVNWTSSNKRQWNVNRNSYIFIPENPFENVVWKMVAICLSLNVFIWPPFSRRLFFKRICLNENVSISLKISLKFVPKIQFNNIPALHQIMAGADQATSHYLNQRWLVYWRIYASSASMS